MVQAVTRPSGQKFRPASPEALRYWRNTLVELDSKAEMAASTLKDSDPVSEDEGVAITDLQMFASNVEVNRRKLLQKIASSIPIKDTAEYKQLPDGEVGIGCQVTLHFQSEEATETWRILGPMDEGAGEDYMTSACEFAQAIIGRQEGEIFTFRGETVRILTCDKLYG